MKRKIARLCLLILISGVLFLNFGCQSNGRLAMQQANYPKDKVDAHGLFNENCAKCHGMDGRARTFHGRLVGAQNFTDAKWQGKVPGGEKLEATKKGAKTTPAFW